jgi:uncharacterized protein YhaN
MVSVLAVTGLVMASSPVLPAQASPVPVARRLSAGRASSPAQAGVGTDIQKVIIRFAAKKLLGFAFNKLALDELLDDQSGQQLSELKAQLDQISAAVKVLQDSLNQISTDLARLSVEGFTIPLGHTISKIKSLYEDFFAYVTQHHSAARSRHRLPQRLSCAIRKPQSTGREQRGN